MKIVWRIQTFLTVLIFGDFAKRNWFFYDQRGVEGTVFVDTYIRNVFFFYLALQPMSVIVTASQSIYLAVVSRPCYRLLNGIYYTAACWASLTTSGNGVNPTRPIFTRQGWDWTCDPWSVFILVNSWLHHLLFRKQINF